MHQDQGGINWNPEPYTVLHAGAKVVVVANGKALNQLDALNGEEARRATR